MKTHVKGGAEEINGVVELEAMQKELEDSSWSL